MKIVSIVRARPNIIKLAPVHKAINTILDHIIIHTGQHYDYKLSEIFFKEFDLPKPTSNLNVGSALPGFQISEMVKRLEKIFLKNRFDLVIVYGDTNSTFAGAFSANRSGIKVAHVEAGLRSFDRCMPEEINRILTDHISDYLFAPVQTSINNLKRERIFRNVIYTGDLSVEIVKQSLQLLPKSLILNDLQLEPKSYILFTMHRIENTNFNNRLFSIISALELLSDMKIIFPIHPRTKKILKDNKLYSKIQEFENIRLVEPMGYIDFLNMMKNAKKVITDSGGIQKESYLLGIPCITIRKNTEWKETVIFGWNILADANIKKIVKYTRDWIPKTYQLKPIFGNGQTSTIIKNSIISMTG